MQVTRLTISNFRGIKSADLLLPDHAVLVGDNNTGKTTILDAIDLVLGPDRLNRFPPITEHDFFRGEYVTVQSDDGSEEGPKIEIEVTITNLNEEQISRFGDYLEFWKVDISELYQEPDPSGINGDLVTEALRITFIGHYDPLDDDFEGKTYFTRSLSEGERPIQFSRKDKQVCGFLYLRSLRTGSRALSLEQGSLLDIILRLKEIRPQMWEDVISTLSDYSVAANSEAGISEVLESISLALKKYVPREWGVKPHLKVSHLTRENLRKVITAFIDTGVGDHSVPFFQQGRGTINMLVLAMLSQIAEDRENIIFAMEEPETAIPPYAQKRVVSEIRKLASQTVFTSHSPYVLEEFALNETVVLTRDGQCKLTQSEVILPDSIKPKRYRQEFRTRFCEGLLTRRILIVEGPTEASSFPVVCRRLAELRPDTYSSLEALGICTIDAGGETNIPDLAKIYRDLGKRVFSICDKQTDTQKTRIEEHVEVLFMHEEEGFEDLVLKNTTEVAMRRFIETIDWPLHLQEKYPTPETQGLEALSEYFGWKKGDCGIADFFAQCAEDDIPQWLRDVCMSLMRFSEYVPVDGDGGDMPHTSETVNDKPVSGSNAVD